MQALCIIYAHTLGFYNQISHSQRSADTAHIRPLVACPTGHWWPTDCSHCCQWCAIPSTAIPDSKIKDLGHQCMARHRWPLVAHHTDVRLIAGGPLATLFDSIVSSVVKQWQKPPSDCLLRVAGGPPNWWLFAPHSHWWTTGEILSAVDTMKLVCLQIGLSNSP